MTQFCTRCVISNNRPIASREYSRTVGSEPGRMAFDAEGVCGACKVHEAKGGVDWQARADELESLLARHRRSDGRPDVLVPGSGGKDSVYAAGRLLDLGMHPLTVTWSPHSYTDVGRRNFYRWLDMGLDNLLVTPNPRVHRLLTWLAFENLGHPFQPFILGQRNCAMLADHFDIDLVFYGEDDAEYEGEAGWQEQREAPDDPHIAGISFDTLVAEYGLHKHDLAVYRPKRVRADVRALGHFLRWDPEEAYYYAVEHAGFEANEERTEGTFTKFNSIDDKLDPLHYYTMHAKFGVGRASHDASMEIRHGRLTREEGIALVRTYDAEVPEKCIAWALGYMGITRAAFDATMARFRKSYPVVS